MTPCRLFHPPGLGPSAQPASSLRRIQGHHRLSGAQQSVELPCSNSKGSSCSTFVLAFARCSPCPVRHLLHCLTSRHSATTTASSCILTCAVCLGRPHCAGLHLSLYLHQGRPQHPHDDADSVDSVSSASADSGPSDAEPFPDASLPASDSAPPRFLLYNHRSNVLHAAIPADPCFLSTVGKRVDGRMLHFCPACGSRAQQLSSSSVVDAQPCLRAACVRQLKASSF